MIFSPTALPVDRRTWVNEQIAHPLTRLDKVPLHAFAAAGQYSDSIAGLGSLNYDPGPFELHAYAGGRQFLGLSPEGRAERASLANERFFYGGELGRSFFGRQMGGLRLGWLHFPDANLAYVTVAVEASTRIAADSPWRFRSLLNLWVGALGTAGPARGEWIHLITELGKTLSDNFVGAHELGLNVTCSYRAADAPALGPGRHEMLMLALGPTLTWQGAIGRWSVGLPFRMFLDSQVAVGKPLTHPSVLGAPGLEVKWGPR